MAEKIFLTGIKPTGEPHLGNFLGAIKPALDLAKNNPNSKKYFFIADQHALTSIKNQHTMHSYRYNIAATWLSFFENIDNCYFYFQSQIPEIFELYWILSCFCPKGLLNRAHAYRALVANNLSNNHDEDRQINQGVFSYPVLMAADILLFQSTHVPVGIDQKQHIEIAIELARHLNHSLSENIPLPQPVINENTELIIGLDGQKMSKNYNNTLPIFLSGKELKKKIGKIQTDSTELGQPLDWENCNVFKIYGYLATDQQRLVLKEKYISGKIGYGHAKNELFQLYEDFFSEYKDRFDFFLNHPKTIDKYISNGYRKASEVAHKNLAKIKTELGF
ncbi:MAG: tryptophan--tRNA ligase [Candidatus Margulisiibacteriota bacterium]